jgi:hypothetical protein
MANTNIQMPPRTGLTEFMAPGFHGFAVGEMTAPASRAFTAMRLSERTSDFERTGR